MKNRIIFGILALFLISWINIAPNNASQSDKPKVGLLIIDAQKWYIPGHPESMYELWKIKGHDRSSESIITSMHNVLIWANKNKLPVFATYEGRDTGPYNLPEELIKELDSSRTTRYIKYFYDATKHKEFKNLLLNSQIDHWIVIGAETDVCVYQTAKGLLKMGKKVTMVEEAIYSGRNNCIVSKNSLESFGVNFVKLNELSNFSKIAQKTNVKTEQPIELENITLTIFPYENTANLNQGDVKRLDYLKKYASIIGLEIQHPDSLSANGKLRILAGNVSIENYNFIKNKTGNDIVVLADATPPMQYKDLPIDWRKHTVKSLFYELMQTVDFYYKTPAELSGWQKELKRAIDSEALPYVESLQNI